MKLLNNKYFLVIKIIILFSLLMFSIIVVSGLNLILSLMLSSIIGFYIGSTVLDLKKRDKK